MWSNQGRCPIAMYGEIFLKLCLKIKSSIKLLVTQQSYSCLKFKFCKKIGCSYGANFMVAASSVDELLA